MENTWGSHLIPGSVDTRYAFYSYPRGILNEAGRAILRFSTSGTGWLKLKGEERKKYVYCLVTMINVGCQSSNLGQVFYFKFLYSGFQIPFFFVSKLWFLTYA